MRSVDRDLTARAAIRNAALALFAEHGPDAVSVRQIASAAQVSPALVLHHFGSKAGLREAVDEHVAGIFEELFDMGGEEGSLRPLVEDGGSIAAVFAASFPTDSPLPAYLRRLLMSGDPGGAELFRRWYDATSVLFERMVEQGLAQQTADPQVRAAFALANDLSLILLRGPLEQALGFDPLSPEGLTRWATEVTAVYRDGMWATPEEHDDNDENDDDAGGSPSARK